MDYHKENERLREDKEKMNEGVVTKTNGCEKLQVECKRERFRVVTYNIHKCRGLDRRVRPARIAKVLGELNADIIALQEVLSIEGKGPEDNQARFIADELGLDYRLGENRKLNGGAYGNVILSRLPFVSIYNYDLSHQGREPRGCLRTDVELGQNRLLHVYNVHLGTSYQERRHQARRLFDTRILRNGDLKGPRIILGDFNEWTRELASRLLSEHFDSVDVRFYLGWPRTYPGVLPFLRLDHIYFDTSLTLEGATLYRSRKALIASDHLPMVADFHLGNTSYHPTSPPPPRRAKR
jgi:endonuclease/exonuclease/phosphatase family metal-dependent hydrolase